MLMHGTIPTGPNALSAEWLTNVLRASGTLVHASVIAFQIDFLVNASSQLVRLHLYYDADEAAPLTLIAKFPSVDPVERKKWTQERGDVREIKFYQRVAKSSQLSTPQCYYSDFDAFSGDSILLLEDLAPGRTWIEVDYAEAALAVREIAKFHAPWWGNDQLATMEWLPGFDGTYFQRLQSKVEEVWESFLTKQTDEWPPPLMNVAAGIKENLHSIIQFSEPPQTIIHSDYYQGNMFFDALAGREPFVVIDWESVRKGRGPYDIARFLGILPIEQRRAEQQELLHLYHMELVAQGVTGYSFNDCFNDFQVAMLELVARAIVRTATRESHPLRTQKLVRYTEAVLDLNADELLSKRVA